MKNIKLYISAAVLALSAASCTVDDLKPQGYLDEETANANPDNLVTAAYASLGDDWYSYPFNLWPYGDMSADDAYKGGSGEGDTGYHPMEIFSTLTSDRGEFDELWYRLYVAISRCNRAMDALNAYTGSGLNVKERKAEVRFLRAHFYYKLQQMWYRVPWITEGMTNAQVEATKQLSHEAIMDTLTSEFTKAYNDLPNQNPGSTGRATKQAAASYLAKCYLNMAYGDGYEETTGYSHIKPEYVDSVDKYTKWVEGSSYGLLEDFGDAFLPENKNSRESVFAVQHSDKTSDNTTFGRANWSNMLNGVWHMWSCGWDFHKPSQNLVNAFKTENGLPMFDTYNDEHNMYPMMHKTPVRKDGKAQKYDPRLFHTVGMPTLPYKYDYDYGKSDEEQKYVLTMDNSRNPGSYGYYCSMKEVPQRSKGETYDNPWQAFAMNDYVFRFSDVLLMRAEALIEQGNLEAARGIINQIRQRAANSVKKNISYASDLVEISTYDDPWTDKEYARKALRWERRLELAMESQRFFDLRRWGMLSTTLNEFFRTEAGSKYEGQTYAMYYKNAFFTKGKNEYFPIASNQINYVPGLYKQNKGY